jgi:hypothetical protein
MPCSGKKPMKNNTTDVMVRLRSNAMLAVLDMVPNAVPTMLPTTNARRKRFAE